MSSDDADLPRRCCACGEIKTPCRTLVTIARKSPTPGKGWGCVVCKLPFDGALAVICDPCAGELGKDDPTIELRWALAGGVDNDERIPLDKLDGTHGHDARYHPEFLDAELN